MTLSHWNRNTLLRQLIVGALTVGLTMGGIGFAQPMQMPNAQEPKGQRPEDQKPGAQKEEIKKPDVQKTKAPKSGGPYPTVGKIIPIMPDSYDVVHSGPEELYFHEGIFYARDPKGFRVVTPPRGCVVGRLPVGFETLIVTGVTYFLYAGVYYNRTVAGYVVVDAPVAPTQTVVVQETAVAPTGNTLTVNVELLNVRSGPGVNHSVVSRVRQGDTLTILGASPEWYYVQLLDGSYGWVMSKYTRSVLPEAKG